MKTCSTCLKSLPLSDFRTARANRDGLTGQCRACLRAYQATYREANREQILECARRYRERNPEKVRDARRAWKASPSGRAERQSIEYRVKAIERTRRWNEANPLRGRIGRAASHANKKYGHLGTFAVAEALELFDGNRGKCAYCPAPATELDHVIPLSRGGENTIDNLLPSCESCNASKGNKPLFTWLEFRAACEA